jgi:lipopolysaccharide/colanic/teichoic acid biosynthesis glycosyltransferase
VAVIIGYVLLSATVFFVKTFAFSRAVMVISGCLAIIALPGWRVVLRLTGARTGAGLRRRGIFGSRTLIVGTGSAGQEVLRRLRARVDDGYDVLGFIDTTNAHIGDRIAGVEIVGSLENVGKIIEERHITDVIFSTDEIPYTAILSVISRSNNRSVNFRLVPTSLESIIGKTRIDDLDTLPLVEIDYNIHRLRNRFVKRIFDLIISALMLLTWFPVVLVLRFLGLLRRDAWLTRWTNDLPLVFWGERSLVGRSDDIQSGSSGHEPGAFLPRGIYLGPRGLTGLVQLHDGNDLTREERERYELYYAKNQSLLLDVEILLKTMLNAFRR